MDLLFSPNPDVEISDDSLDQIVEYNYPNNMPPSGHRYPWKVRLAADDLTYNPTEHVGAWQSAGPPEEQIATLKACNALVTAKPEDYGGEAPHAELCRAWATTLSRVS